MEKIVLLFKNSDFVSKGYWKEFLKGGLVSLAVMLLGAGIDYLIYYFYGPVVAKEVAEVVVMVLFGFLLGLVYSSYVDMKITKKRLEELKARMQKLDYTS